MEPLDGDDVRAASPPAGPSDRPFWDPGRCRPAGAGRWSIRWTETTASTNDDLVRRSSGTVVDRTVLVADLQTAGRGRLGRRWQAPPRAALTFSVLLRDTVPPARRGWIGAILGLAVSSAVRARTGLRADLKWPNDVLIGDRKVAGILAEMAPTALIVGAGINLSLGEAELPRPDATSLVLAGADRQACRREEMLAAILDGLAPLLERWRAAGGDADAAGIRADYLSCCATLGRAVRIELPAGGSVTGTAGSVTGTGGSVTGTAVDVTDDGSIVIDDGTALRRFAAGDVRHLRTC